MADRQPADNGFTGGDKFYIDDSPKLSLLLDPPRTPPTFYGGRATPDHVYEPAAAARNNTHKLTARPPTMTTTTTTNNYPPSSSSASLSSSASPRSPTTTMSPSATTADYQVYKVWLSQPGDLPDHVTLAVVQSHLPRQDFGTLYHIVGNIYGGFRRSVDADRGFGAATSFVRKQHVFGMSAAEYPVLQQTCQAIPVPILGEYNTIRGPEDWVDSVVFKYKNEIAFQEIWRSYN